MDLDRLRIFYDLAVTESIRKLSEINKLPIAKISRELSALEKEIGYQLIDRKPRSSRMQLTLQGKILFDNLPHIFGVFENLKQIMHTDPKLNKGEITIYTTNSLIEDWIVYMLPKLYTAYPNINLNLIAYNNLLTTALKEKVISISPYSEEKSKTTCQVKLLDFHVGLWASKEYLDHYGRPKTLEDLERHKLILFAKEVDQMTYPTLHWHLINSHIDISKQTCINSSTGLLRAAANGLGIISLSQENVKAVGCKLERVLSHVPGPVIPMCFTYPKYWEGNSIIEILKKFFLQEFNQIKGGFED